MIEVQADLHIHTGLSPCACDEMTPPAIVRAAMDRGLGMIAICDHNAAGNTAATQAAARGRIAVIAGMEITTEEEVHVVGLFPDAAAAEAAARQVQATLPDATAASRSFGEQRLMDADGRVTGTERKMLAAASALGLSRGVALIKRHGGLAVAAHVDRPSFSVLSQLGVFPEDAGFDAVEVFSASRIEDGPRQGEGPAGPLGAPRLAATQRGAATPARQIGSPPAPEASLTMWGLPVLAGSDSHFLSDIGRVRTVLRMREASFDELARALRGEGGRSVRRA